jgi:hypothetical protein
MLIVVTALSAVIAAAFVASPWKYVLFVLAAIGFGLAIVQRNALARWQARMSADQDYLLSQDSGVQARAQMDAHAEGLRREELLEPHFTLFDDPVSSQSPRDKAGRGPWGSSSPRSAGTPKRSVRAASSHPGFRTCQGRTSR